MGSPVLPARQWMRQQAQLTRVGDLIVKVRELEKKIKELEN